MNISAKARPADLLGLTADEYDRAAALLERPPSHAELGIIAAMWSEHCAYKSTRRWLKTLPTEAPWVVQGPGENAGAVDIGDGLAAVFKIESHNHPSFIEPYQGAATGVGGILRDVFTMGARPIANLNALRFGAPDHPKTRHLISGVVAGIGGYGNCIGVPTVGGEVNFDPSYNGNILVNAMTVGIARADRLFRSAAKGVGLPVFYVGATTGRDGIHGATMASASFSGDAEAKRPTVQVGDPFTEKLLLEACLELMATDAIVAVQDMGAAGLTSSSVEMAAKGGVGLELDLDRVPAREVAMTAYEIMLSESQERMVMVLQPGAEAQARQIFAKWELDAVVIGRTTDTGRLVVRRHGQIEADIPLPMLVDDAPDYDRPWTPTPKQAVVDPARVPPPADTNSMLLDLLSSPDLASRRWVWEQYDSTVMADTVQGPGGDAAIVRVHGTDKALAITTDCTPRYVVADPVEGAKQAVAEAWRNLSAVGARPLAITNNLNFGSPERPEIMGQIVGAIQGMSAACTALDFPVVSGNVSLYNQTDGEAILPTPVIGGVGLIDDWRRTARAAFTAEGEAIILIGETRGWLGGSLYLRHVRHAAAGAPPPVDLDAERRAGDLVRRLISGAKVTVCHDVSDGGLAVAVAEMAIAGGVGAAISREPTAADPPMHAWLFGEDQGRYLVATNAADELLETACAAAVNANVIGRTGGGSLTLPGAGPISLAELTRAFEGWFPAFMDAP